MEQWVLLHKGANFTEIGKKFGISKRLAALIRNRDVVGDQAIDRYLNGTLSDLYDGALLKDLDVAVKILQEKMAARKKIRVIGDYDIDGICSTYLLIEGLKELGAVVDFDIPDRVADGYGLNEHLLQLALDAGVDTVLTCDNGIAASQEISFAKRQGLTVLVTDHHEIPYTAEGQMQLPPADAVVDPKRTDSSYPFQGLCGTAVAYKLLEVLYRNLGKTFTRQEEFLQLTALATVGDVMDLVDENRIFVKIGLPLLQKTENLGLKALLNCCGIGDRELTPYHIGYVLGPCLNASGRLDSAKRSLALLEAKDPGEADNLAGELHALNESRKELTNQQVDRAIQMIEQEGLLQDRVLVLVLQDCHESLAGIVAGRIREKYHRPTIVLTESAQDLKGSGRSIPAYHLYNELAKCQSLLTKFGGHAQAAGLSMKREHVEELRTQLNQNCQLTEQDLMEKVQIDMELPFSCVTEAFLQELDQMKPFGQGNPQPLFAAREVTFFDSRLVGKNQNVLRTKVRDGQGTVLEGVCFTEAEILFSELNDRQKWSITFYPEVNEYRGLRTLQIVITHCQCMA